MNKSTWESTAKPIIVLSVIAMVASFLLALVNGFTEPVIAANSKAATLAAYVEVMPTVSDAADLEEVAGFTAAGVEGVVRAADGSIAVKAGESGFDGGIVTVIMGFDASGTVTGVYVDAITQTSGIGSHVADDAVKNQFVGIDASANVVMGENGLDGYSGATISSKALFAAVNDCINAYNEVA